MNGNGKAPHPGEETGAKWGKWGKPAGVVYWLSL